MNNTYYYWLESVSFSGETEIHQHISLTIPDERLEEALRRMEGWGG